MTTSSIQDFTESGTDKFILSKVNPNQRFTYYVGAVWEGNTRFSTPGAWEKELKKSDWKSVNKIY